MEPKQEEKREPGRSMSSSYSMNSHEDNGRSSYHSTHSRGSASSSYSPQTQSSKYVSGGQSSSYGSGGQSSSYGTGGAGGRSNAPSSHGAGKPGDQRLEFYIPADKVGAVLGQGGRHCQEVQKTFRVNLHINSRDEYPNGTRQVVIHGQDMLNIIQARDMVIRQTEN